MILRPSRPVWPTFHLHPIWGKVDTGKTVCFQDKNPARNVELGKGKQVFALVIRFLFFGTFVFFWPLERNSRLVMKFSTFFLCCWLHKISAFASFLFEPGSNSVSNSFDCCWLIKFFPTSSFFSAFHQFNLALAPKFLFFSSSGKPFHVFKRVLPFDPNVLFPVELKPEFFLWEL